MSLVVLRSKAAGGWRERRVLGARSEGDDEADRVSVAMFDGDVVLDRMIPVALGSRVLQLQWLPRRLSEVEVNDEWSKNGGAEGRRV